MIENLLGVENIFDVFARDSLVSLLLLALVICVFGNLFFAHKLLSARKGKISNEQEKNVIRDFLKNQINQTNNTERHKKRKHFEKNVMQLRHAYLAIEKCAIERGIDTEPYWQVVYSKVKKLLSIYEHHQSDGLLKEVFSNIKAITKLLDKSPASDAKNRMFCALDKLQNACKINRGNPKRLREINDKLIHLLDKFKHEGNRERAYKDDATINYIQASAHPVQKIKKHISNIEEITSKADSKLSVSHGESVNSLAETNENMRSHIRQLEIKLALAQSKLADQKQNKADQESWDSSSIKSEIHDISDEIIEASEREIDRLTTLLREKKGIIHELEASLHSAQKETKTATEIVSSASDLATVREEELDLLRRNLIESEQCIVLLEQELGSLKENLKYAEQLKNTPINDKEIEELTRTVDELKLEMDEFEAAWKEKKVLVNYIMECLEAGTTEDVSLSVFDSMSTMGFSADILIYTPARTIEVNDIGKIPHRTKLLLDSLHIGEANLSRDERKLNFRWQNLSGTVVRKDGKVITEKEKENLVEMSNLTDKLLQRLITPPQQSQNQRSMESISNSIKFLTKELDDSFEQVFKRVDDKIHDGFGQLRDVARSSGMQAGQIASIKNLENTTSDEIKAEKRIKLRVHKLMLSLLEKIESQND